MTVYRRPDPIPLHHSRPATDTAFRSVRAESEDLHRLVSRQIFTAISSGRFPEGSILPNEQVLSDELGVSRTALRESVKGLVSKGMLETRRRRGTLVLNRSQWNLLDAEVIGWLRRDDSAAVSAQLWETVAVNLPGIAAAAAARRGAASLRYSPLITGEQTARNRVEFLVDIGRASGNKFLLAIVSTSLFNLLETDSAVLDRTLSWLDRHTALQLTELIGAGDVGPTRAFLQSHLTGLVSISA